MRPALAALFSAAAPALAADVPGFEQPVACNVGGDCYIQNYVDADPGPGARDFRCAALTYDGHTGTDFALPTLAAMSAGVTVTATATGRVLSYRDGMEDHDYLTDPATVEGTECGNGVVIDHGDGWHSQYCHMRKGSVIVRPGDQVATGAPLGLVGISGKSDFPHLHFEIRHNGVVIDPFDPGGETACTLPPPRSLWRNHPPAYTPGGVLSAGFASAIPDFDAIRAGTAHENFSSDTPALVLWGYGFGARTGDIVLIEIDGPAGFRFTERFVFEHALALYSRAAGKRRPEAGWTSGTYTGYVSLYRSGRTISQTSSTVEIAR